MANDDIKAEYVDGKFVFTVDRDSPLLENRTPEELGDELRGIVWAAYLHSIEKALEEIINE